MDVINEHDLVAVKHDRPEHKLKAGDIGTVVSVYQNGKAFLVEFPDLENDPYALIDLAVDDVHKADAAETTKYKESTQAARDRVILLRDLPDEKLQKGDLGAVVSTYDDGAGCIVEFASLTGETIAVVALDREDVRDIRATDLAHVREYA